MNLVKFWRSAFLGQHGTRMLSMKKLGRICPVSEKIDGVEAPSSLKARFSNIYVSLNRDTKPE